jgi:hypothetical protein
MRLLAILLLLIPLTVTAENFVITWGAYSQPQATMNAECRKGSATFAPKGQAPATGSITFTEPMEYGERIDCQIYATFGDQVSSRSGVVSYLRPFPSLETPENVNLQVAPEQ